jgi:hypothetical protein
MKGFWAVITVCTLLAGCVGAGQRAGLEVPEPYNPQKVSAEVNCGIKYWGYRNILKPVFNIINEPVETILKTSLDPDTVIMSSCVQKTMAEH